MNCTVISANNFSALSWIVSRISPVQSAVSVRKSTLYRPFIFPILRETVLALANERRSITCIKNLLMLRSLWRERQLGGLAHQSANLNLNKRQCRGAFKLLQKLSPFLPSFPGVALLYMAKAANLLR